MKLTDLQDCGRIAYARGFASGVEAAAKAADDWWLSDALRSRKSVGNHIRALVPASPPTRERERCAECGGTGRFVDHPASVPCPSCGGTGRGT